MKRSTLLFAVALLLVQTASYASAEGMRSTTAFDSGISFKTFASIGLDASATNNPIPSIMSGVGIGAAWYFIPSVGLGFDVAATSARRTQWTLDTLFRYCITAKLALNYGAGFWYLFSDDFDDVSYGASLDVGIEKPISAGTNIFAKVAVNWEFTDEPLGTMTDDLTWATLDIGLLF